MSKRRRSFVQRSYGTTLRKPPTIEHLLEQGSLEDIERAKKITAQHLKYQWEYYSELAHQRNQVHDELKKVLIQSSENFRFEKWQRAVKWKYGLHPLSTAGSLTFIGGRFNAGIDINSAIPSFPALYLAVDKDTVLQETLGQIEVKGSQLSARELALINPESEVIVSVSGELEKVIDLRTAAKLNAFVELTKGFKLSPALRESAKRLGLPKPTIALRSQDLLDTLLSEEWRMPPTVGDVPANSQIFGHLIYQAGIEGILYPSRLTGKDCLAIFPNNFAVTSSYITLDDEPPHAGVPRRIDSTNWRFCELSAKELIEGAAVC